MSYASIKNCTTVKRGPLQSMYGMFNKVNVKRGK